MPAGGIQFAGPDDKRQPARPVFAGSPDVGGIWTKPGTLLGAINEALGTAQGISQAVGGSKGQPGSGGSGGADTPLAQQTADAQPDMSGGSGTTLGAPPGGAVQGGAEVGAPNATGAYNPYAPASFGAGGGAAAAPQGGPAVPTFAGSAVNLNPGEQGGPSTLQQLGQLAMTVAKMAGSSGG